MLRMIGFCMAGAIALAAFGCANHLVKPGEGSTTAAPDMPEYDSWGEITEAHEGPGGPILVVARLRRWEEPVMRTPSLACPFWTEWEILEGKLPGQGGERRFRVKFYACYPIGWAKVGNVMYFYLSPEGKIMQFHEPAKAGDGSYLDSVPPMEEKDGLSR